jgi:hypothetical protein
MWREELKRPATAIAIVLAVVSMVAGIFTSLYFYQIAEKIGKAAIYVEQVQVFDKTRTRDVPLRVLDASGQPINNNVYAASVTIWNSGNAEIKKEDVREPFWVSVEGNPRVIDIATTFVTRNNVEGFSLDGNGKFEWQHFDVGEGIKLRLIYTDSVIHDIIFSGYAVNTGGIVNYNKESEKLRSNQNWYTLIGESSLVFITVMLLTIVMIMTKIRGRQGKTLRLSPTSLVCRGLCWALYGCSGLYLLRQIYQPLTGRRFRRLSLQRTVAQFKIFGQVPSAPGNAEAALLSGAGFRLLHPM